MIEVAKEKINDIHGKEDIGAENIDKNKTERIKKAKDVLQTLDKTIKTYKLFAKKHQNRERAKTELFTKFSAFLEEYQKLPLTVRAFEFLYEGEIVYVNTEVDQSYSFKFFQDGFRNITFNTGLTLDEIEGFIDIIAVDLSSIEFQDESPATLMWNKNLEHIEYTIIETFTDLNPEDMKEMKNEMNKIFDSAFSAEYKPENKREKKDGTKILGSQKKTIKKGAFFNSSANIIETDNSQEIKEKEILSLTTEDENKLRLFARAKSFLNTQKFIQILLFMLGEEEKDNDTFSNAKIMLNYMVDHLLNINEIKWIVSIFYKIRNLKSEKKEEKENIKIKQLFESLITKERIELIIDKLNQDEMPPNLDLVRFFMLSIREAESSTIFLDALTKIANRNLRRKISELLVEPVKKNLRSIEYRMQQSNEVDFILEMIFILNKINSSEAIDIVMDLKKHQDKSVRLELVRSFSERLDDTAKRLFIHAIKDEVEEIRLAALSQLANFSDIEIDIVLLESVKAPEFHRKSLDEKKKILLIVAKSEDNTVAEFLEKLLKKRFIFDKNIIDTMGCSALVLGILQKSDYLPILKKCQKGFFRPKPVKRACEFAIRSIEGAR